MADMKKGTVRPNEITFHYLELGEGPLALCMHGFPDNAYSYRYLLPELAQAGFRAVSPYMRGYSPTGSPRDGAYQTAVLSRDVLDLIEALGYEEAVLVGHDWGARAVCGAAILDPRRVTKLVTVAAAHPAVNETLNFHFLKGAWHAFYFQLPFAEAAVAHNDYAFIEEWLRDSSPNWDIPNETLESIKKTFRTPGVLKAALGYYRHNITPALQNPALEDEQWRVDNSPISVSTLAFQGTRDRPRRLEVFQSMDPFFTGGLEKIVIEGTGHFMHLEKPEEVNNKIVEFCSC